MCDIFDQWLVKKSLSDNFYLILIFLWQIWIFQYFQFPLFYRITFVSQVFSNKARFSLFYYLANYDLKCKYRYQWHTGHKWLSCQPGQGLLKKVFRQSLKVISQILRGHYFYRWFFHNADSCKIAKDIEKANFCQLQDFFTSGYEFFKKRYYRYLQNISN